MIATINVPVLLSCVLSDGNTSRGVRATIYNSSGVVQSPSPFQLPSVAGGLYQAQAWTPTTVGYYAVIYQVYTDSTFTTLATQYQVSGDDVTVQAVAPTAADITALKADIDSTNTTIIAGEGTARSF